MTKCSIYLCLSCHLIHFWTVVLKQNSRLVSRNSQQDDLGQGCCVFFRAVKVNALIYEIIVAEINAIKYFNAVNAILLTCGPFVYFQWSLGTDSAGNMLAAARLLPFQHRRRRRTRTVCSPVCSRARVSVCWCVRTCLCVRVCASGWNSAVRDTESRGEI